MADAAGIRPYNERNNGEGQFPLSVAAETEKAGLLGNTDGDVAPFNGQVDYRQANWAHDGEQSWSDGYAYPVTSVTSYTESHETIPKGPSALVRVAGGLAVAARPIKTAFVKVATGSAVAAKTGVIKLGTSAKGQAVEIIDTRKAKLDEQKRLRHSIKSNKRAYTISAEKSAKFDLEVLPGIHADIRARQNERNDRHMEETILPEMIALLDAPEPISASLVAGTKLQEGLAKEAASKRADIVADKLLVRSNTELAITDTATSEKLDRAKKHPARHTPEGRVEYAALMLAGLKSDIPTPTTEASLFEEVEYIEYRKAVQDKVEGVIDEATQEAIGLYYRLETKDPAVHNHLAFLEFVEAKKLGPSHWTQQVDADGSIKHLLKDEIDIEYINGKIKLTPNPNVSGFARAFDPAEGQFHNLLAGLSVEGYVKTPNHESGGTGLKMQYYTDQVILPTDDKTPVKAVMFTEVSSLALTSEGLGVAQDESNRVFREQQVSDLVDPLVAAEAGVVAKAIEWLIAGKFSSELKGKAKELSKALPVPPMRQSSQADAYGERFASALSNSGIRALSATTEITQEYED